jgi:ABC-2 type transport system permease protein
MSKHALGAVVRRQWLIAVRDRRLRMLSIILLLACLAAFISGLARGTVLQTEVEAARLADARTWQQQGVVNPHQAAHFGRHVFQPAPLLAAFDPGVLDHVGTVLRLEAHRQSPASGRPSDAGTSLTRFDSLNAASLLQLLGPLLIILIGFTTFSGQQPRTLLRQEIGAGVAPRVLMLGQLAAWGAVIATVLALFTAVAFVMLVFADAEFEHFWRIGWIVLGYALYLFAFLAITLGISARFSSARGALVTLLAFWVAAALMLPRIAPAVAAELFPTPSAQQLQADVQNAIDFQMDGADARDSRPERLRQMILARYGVEKLEDLPVSLSGALLEYSEAVSTDAYRRHFAEVFRLYERQADLQRWLGLASPLMALKPWSAGLAGSDFAVHQQFLDDAEAYRFRFVQALNRDITEHRANTQDAYASDVAGITGSLEPFQPAHLSLPAALRRLWPDLLILATWAGASLAFALWSATRLQAAEL